MTAWTEAAVAAAAAAWAWVPPDADEVRTDSYHLVRYPGHYYTYPACVLWSRSERPAGELIDEVGGQVRDWGLAEVHWDVSAATRPAGTEAELVRRGAALADTAQVLAYDMTGGIPELDEPAQVRWEVAGDEASVRAGRLIYREVWGEGGEPDGAEVRQELASARRELADWSGFRVVSFVAGEPACGLRKGFAR